MFLFVAFSGVICYDVYGGPLSMKLQKSVSSKDTIYYLAKTVRDKKKTKTINIKKLGSYNELIHKYKDPEAYCRKLVEKANKELKESILTFDETIDFNSYLEGNNISSNPTYKNIGCLYLDNVFNSLKIDEFINDNCQSYRFKYDLLSSLKLLTYSRILDPHSKKSTFDNSEFYLANFDLTLDDIYRSLDVISELSDNLQAHLYKKSNLVHKRKKSILYYDCTNYYFEIETENEEGLRKYGVSKEHRPNPIVQMGLFIDEEGIPVAFDISSGNKNEQSTTLPLEKKIVKDYKLAKFIYCSDAGLCSESIKRFNSFQNRAYVITQPLKKLPSKEQEYIFKDLNWRLFSNNQNVSLEEFKKVGDRYLNGERLSKQDLLYLSHDIVYKDYPYKNERIIITFSLKSYIYQKSIFNKQLNRAQEKTKKNTLSYGPNDLRRLIEVQGVTSEGEIADEKILTIDSKKVEKESTYHGFYACATNLEDEAKEVIKINKARWKIEDCFRTMKTSFKARPVYLQKDNRIKAHFFTCYLALLIFSLLKVKLKNQDITISNLIETMKSMNIDIHQKGFGKALYTNSKTLEELEKVFKLGLNKRYYEESKLKKLVR